MCRVPASFVVKVLYFVGNGLIAEEKYVMITLMKN